MKIDSAAKLDGGAEESSGGDENLPAADGAGGIEGFLDRGGGGGFPVGEMPKSSMS